MQDDDPRWSDLIGGYGLAYDPRPALRALEREEVSLIWEELWENLYHQGDVASASYAAVPEIIRIIGQTNKPDWNGYALISAIEEARHNERNPSIPKWLETCYHDAWQQIPKIASSHIAQASDAMLIRSILAALAHSKGQTDLGKIALYTQDELLELLEASK